MLRTIVVAVLLAAAAAPASAGVLDLGQIGEFVYKNVKQRGVAVQLFALNGQKATGGAIKFGVLHNKKKTETYLAATVGIEVAYGAGMAAKGRLHMGAPINVADVLRRVSRWSWLEGYVDFIEFPKDWELWAGPFVRAPTQQGDTWMWKTHTGAFISIGKKFTP